MVGSCRADGVGLNYENGELSPVSIMYSGGSIYSDILFIVDIFNLFLLFFYFYLLFFSVLFGEMSPGAYMYSGWCTVQHMYSSILFIVDICSAFILFFYFYFI